ncbi:hypothetical protein RBG61_13130 [Paludicola sp. MB14-C6]|uniref:hypothetical protein n=1 Tax=Paludihabitans sp. MB14-C6 TaxID=3070656 RepID=UPI0027DB1028|nr:hypothetical protein [Paludicola sp. MB14-C6]WMJ22917.1 hypothetical protein RBG61_13130 [Paludicola sp. MB14-C6]
MNNVNFHQTFPVTLEYISRILEITDMCAEMSKEEISELTGIPTGKSSGKVEPHISYAIYMGLVTDVSKESGKYKLIRTELGNAIVREDIGIREEVSQLLCHSRLSSPSTGALLWSTIIKKIMPNYPNGIKLMLLEDMLKKQSSFSGKKTINISPFYTTYQKSLDSLNLFEKSKETLQLVPHKNKSELIYVYAYTLLYEWEQTYPQHNEITADQLFSLGIGATFGFADSVIYQVLEQLSEIGVIRINGQLSPFTVIKNTTSDIMIEKVYSLLC